MRVVRCLIAVAVISGIGWLFPLFHVVPLKTVAAEKAAATFNAPQFADSFWTNQLLPAIKKTVGAGTLLAAIHSDPAAARKKFSRQVGLSESYFYFLSGTGRVVAVSGDEISLAITSGSTNAEVSLQTGLVFGDAIRDGTGLLDAGTYPNHLVETRVLPPLRQQAKIGATISFAGCAEVDDESTDLQPLKVVPIEARVQ
jgi:predicted lipoprotein